MTRIVSPTAVLLGLLISSPSLWAALNGTASAEGAVLRFVVGSVLAGVALSALGGLVTSYARTQQDAETAATDTGPRRRAAD